MERVKEVPARMDLGELFAGIYFDFARAAITPASAAVLDRIVRILCADTSRHYLITGCTDARGSLAYNAALSERRARAVVQALTERGVPAQMLKACGVSKKIAHAAPENFFENGTRSFFSRVRRDAFASPCVSIPILRASYGHDRSLVRT